jgi:hypothetical protein
MTLETIAPLSDDPAIRLRRNPQLTRQAGERGVSPPAQGHDHGAMYGYYNVIRSRKSALGDKSSFCLRG